MNDLSVIGGRNRGRWVLAGIFALFLFPVLAAWLLNIETPDWLPSAKSNHGELIRPPLPFPTAGLQSKGTAEQVGTGLLHGKWTLVHVAPSSCLADCARAVYRMRQVRHALGKDMRRIQRLLVSASENVEETQKKVRLYDDSIAIISAKPGWFTQATFVRPGIEIYLVDPQGFLILSYADNADPSGVIKDLKRLLKISKIG